MGSSALWRSLRAFWLAFESCQGAVSEPLESHLETIDHSSFSSQVESKAIGDYSFGSEADVNYFYATETLKDGKVAVQIACRYLAFCEVSGWYWTRL